MNKKETVFIVLKKPDVKYPHWDASKTASRAFRHRKFREYEKFLRKDIEKEFGVSI